jgi:hypothetical protein
MYYHVEQRGREYGIFFIRIVVVMIIALPQSIVIVWRQSSSPTFAVTLTTIALIIQVFRQQYRQAYCLNPSIPTVQQSDPLVL